MLMSLGLVNTNYHFYHFHISTKKEGTCLDQKQKRLIVSLCSMILFAVMNGTMFNVTLPKIAEDYGLSPSEVSWVVVGYGTVFAIGSVTYGKLADLFPVRNLIMIGLSLFSVGSILGFVTDTYVLTILSRLIQASGAAAIPALGMIVSTKYFPPERRGYALGMIASTVAFGTGIGPIIGGAITQLLGWHFLFLVSLLILGVLPFIRKALPIEQAPRGVFDTVGAVLFAAGIASLLFGINLNKWFLMVSALVFIIFAVHIRRTAAPFIQIHLLQNERYRRLLLLGFLAFSSIMTSFFVLPLMLQAANGLTAGMIGLVLFPGSMAAALLGSKAGKLSDQYGSAPVIRGGASIMAAGFLLLSTVIGASALWVAVILVIIYVGFASVQSSLGNFIASTLDRREVGIGMGLYNLINFLGGALGPAFMSHFLEARTGRWNPFAATQYSSYSNTFLLLAMLCILAVGVLAYAQSAPGQKARPNTSDGAA